MIDKYTSAILEHEQRRQNIIHLTKSIGEAAIYDCHGIEGSFPNTTYCIDRFWQANRDYPDSIDDMDLDPAIFKEDVERRKVDLCDRCMNIDELVNKRKKEKGKFGVAKRRIGLLARGLTKDNQ